MGANDGVNGDQLGIILDVKLRNLNECVEKIDGKLDRHLDWHFEEEKHARETAEAALGAAHKVAEATLEAARQVAATHRWETWKILLAAFTGVVASGLLTMVLRFI